MTARGDQTRAALLRAAAELVADVGYHRATTRAIAQRAGVAEGTIYRHFPDKRALFTAAILDGQRDLTAWMEQLPGRAGAAAVADTLLDCFTQLSQLRQAVIPLELALAAAPELAVPPPDDVEHTVESLGGPPHQLARYLAAEQRLGRVRSDLDPTMTSITLLACLFGLQTSPLARPDGLDRTQLRQLVQLFLHGLTD
jgi:AcrR family transcriptional regulator